jgi:hypothetical protein
MNGFDDFAYPDKFVVTKSNGSVLELRGSINGSEMFLVTSEDLTPKDAVVRKLSTAKLEKYEILDVQFVEAVFDFPATQQLRVKRVFD